MKTFYLLPVIGIALLSSCSSSPWKRSAPPLYHTPGLVLYREYLEKDDKIVPQGYQHPIDIPLEKTALVLSHLVVRDDFLLSSKNAYVFTKEEIAKAAEPLTVALKALRPDERLRFLVLQDSWQEALLGASGTSGVIFSTQAGFLNLALDNIHERVNVPDGGEPMKIPFSTEPTELTGASPIIPGPGMKTHSGPDGTQYSRWVEITLADVKPLPPPPPPAEKPIAPPAQITIPDRPPLPGSPVPSSASVAEPKGPAKIAPDEERYQQARKRLETLNRLRKDGAITEEQFQAEYAKAMAELQD